MHNLQLIIAFITFAAVLEGISARNGEPCEIERKIQFSIDHIF